MKYLKKFNENYPGDNYTYTIKRDRTLKPGDSKDIKSSDTIYDKSWESLLPEKLSINYHQKTYSFKKGNVMLNGDMVQITYDSGSEIWGAPDTLEFDIYFVKDTVTNNIRLDIDITYGDMMACEFSVDYPNKVKVIEYTSHHSKTDTSNTIFALEDESLKGFVDFLNKFGLKLSVSDFKFLDKYDNYNPS